jgi:metallo-beta-lactamase class B
MRTLAVLAMILLRTSCSSTPPANQPKLTLSHLVGPIYVVEDNFYVKENSVVYIGERGVTVIGATWTPETARILHGEIGKVTNLPVTEVILTDHHLDRVGGNAYWVSIGASLVSTQQTADLMRTRWDSLIRTTREVYKSFPAIPAVYPTEVHAGDFEVQGGRVRALYLGPSHTDDGIFVYFPEDRVLYAGCIIKEQLGNLDDANVAEYPKTLRRLQALGLEIDTIIAGHWNPVHGPGLIQTYLKLIEEHSSKMSEQ